MSVLMYASETWTLMKRDTNRLRAFETKCLRSLLNVKWQQKVKNTDIMKRTGTSINIVERIIERKLNFFGHICRTQGDRLLKQAVFGILDGKNYRGRPKRRWSDDLVDWCNKDICTLHGLAMNRRNCSHFVKYVTDTNGHWPMQQDRERYL